MGFMIPMLLISPIPQVIERLTQEPCGPARAVVDSFANLWLDDLHNRPNQRARCVILSASPPGIPHVLDLGFVQVAQFVLLGLRTKTQFVDVVEDLLQVVAAFDLVLDLPENLPDLVFDRVRPARLLREAVQVRKQLLIDEVAQVVAGHRLVVVNQSVLAFGSGPAFPALLFFEDESVFLFSSAASSALSCSCPSRYFKNSSHDVCSV